MKYPNVYFVVSVYTFVVALQANIKDGQSDSYREILLVQRLLLMLCFISVSSRFFFAKYAKKKTIGRINYVHSAS